MTRLNSRRLRANASYDDDVLTFATSIEAPVVFIDGASVASIMDANTILAGEHAQTLTAHAGLHTQHTASLATKVASNHGVHSGDTSIAALSIGHAGPANATVHVSGDLIVGADSTEFQIGHDNSNSIYLEATSHSS